MNAAVALQTFNALAGLTMEGLGTVWVLSDEFRRLK